MASGACSAKDRMVDNRHNRDTGGVSYPRGVEAVGACRFAISLLAASGCRLDCGDMGNWLTPLHVVHVVWLLGVRGADWARSVECGRVASAYGRSCRRVLASPVSPTQRSADPMRVRWEASRQSPWS